MIRIIEGVPGAGKTYFMVCWILERYYRWDKRYYEYMPRGENPVTIITNIDGLKLPNVLDLDEEIKKAGGLSKFFHKDNFSYKNAVVVIDEAQSERYFHRKYFDRGVFDFFDWHRHLGLEIFLMTQNVKNLAPDLREIQEEYFRAARKSLQMGGFRYYRYIEEERHGTSFLKYDQRVFAVYKSVSSGSEIKQPKSVIPKYVLSFIVLLVIVIFGFMHFLKWWGSPKTKSAGLKKSANVQVAKQENLPLNSPVSPSQVNQGPNEMKPVINEWPRLIEPLFDSVRDRAFVTDNCQPMGMLKEKNKKNDFQLFKCGPYTVVYKNNKFYRATREVEQMNSPVPASEPAGGERASARG